MSTKIKHLNRSFSDATAHSQQTENSDENNDTDVARLREEVRRWQKVAEEKELKISELEQKAIESEQMRQDMQEMKKSMSVMQAQLHRVEEKLQISNIRKLRQLEKLGEKSPEVAELINKLKEETRSIERDLAEQNEYEMFQTNESISDQSTATPGGRPLPGKHASAVGTHSYTVYF